MRNIVAISFLLFGCSHTPQNRDLSSLLPADPEIQPLHQQAMDHYLQGNYPRAIQEMEAALLLSPQQDKNGLVHLLFYSYLATGNYRAALATAEQNLKAQPFQPTNYFEVGLAQYWLGKAKDSAESLRRALEFESHAPKVHFYLGLAALKLNRASEAQESFKDAEREYQLILYKNPEDFEANFELALQYAFTESAPEKLARVLENTKSALPKTSEGETSPLLSRFQIPVLEGILHLRKGNFAIAKTILINAIKECPAGARADLAEIYFYLGENARLSEDPTAATSFYEQSLELDPFGPFEGKAKAALTG